MQFIPIVEPVDFRQVAPQHWDEETMPELGSPRAKPGTPDSVVTEWSVDPDDWGDFLCRVFDEWYRKDLGKIYVNYFDAAVETWMGHVSPLCTQAPDVRQGAGAGARRLGLRLRPLRLPRVPRRQHRRSGRWRRWPSRTQQEKFGRMKEGALPQQCRDCDYQFACFGECPKNRFIKTPDGEPGLNYLCSGWQKFFTHIDPFIEKIVRSLGRTVEKAPRKAAAAHWQPEKQR